MSHAIGAVRFEDGKILYYEYNGTTDVVIDKLYETQDEVLENWRKYPDANCGCGNDEPVRIMSTYGDGFAWDGRACRNCYAITDGFTVDFAWESGTYEDKEPEWSPFKPSSEPDSSSES